MPSRLAAQLAVLVLASAVLAGCGGSSSESDGSRTGTATDVIPIPGNGDAPVGAVARACDADDVDGLRATGVSCSEARKVMLGWRRRNSCSSPAGASRVSCTSRSYRCLGARTDRGIAVSCSRPGRSVAFLAGRD